jgi:hypothetical protein
MKKVFWFFSKKNTLAFLACYQFERLLSQPPAALVPSLRLPQGPEVQTETLPLRSLARHAFGAPG